jgi:hypothetical protein
VRLSRAAGLALLLLPLALLVHPAWVLASLLGLLYPSRWEERRALADLDQRYGLAYRSALEAPANHPWHNQLQTEARASLLEARLPAVPWLLATLYLAVVGVVWVLPPLQLPFVQPPVPTPTVSGPEAVPSAPGPTQTDPTQPQAAEPSPPEEPQPGRETERANDPTAPAPPTEPGQEAQDRRDVQGQEQAEEAARPDQPGQNLQDRQDAPPTPQNGQTGQNQPGQNGQPQTTQPGQDAQPSQAGRPQPEQTQPGQAPPSQPGQPPQNQPGPAQPMQPGPAQPMQPGPAQPSRETPGQNAQGQGQARNGERGSPQGQPVRRGLNQPVDAQRPAGEAPLTRGENRQGRPQPLPSPWQAGQPPQNVQRQAENFLESEPLPPEVRNLVRRYFELPEQ